jgi:endonuclease/exonuclease/phosphatase (EEP) superfamily protein YafD
MRLWRIIATATAAEAAVFAAVFSIAGLGGAWSGWLDLLNNFAPIWFAVLMLATPLAALLVPRGVARWGVLALALSGLLVSGAEVLPELAAAVTLPHFGDGQPALAALKIVTFNTWSDNDRPQQVVERVQAADPDAFALIEMGWPLLHHGIEGFAARYPYRTTPKGGCPRDMQIFSKRPFSAWGCAVTYDPARPEVTAAIVWGRTQAPDGRPFTFATTHYAWPFPGGGQAMQMAALTRWTTAHADGDLILTGDFNLTPWSFALHRQDGKLKLMMRRDHAVFTWPATIARLYRPAPFAILPIDHIYAGRAWRTLDVRRLARAGSDHYGIEATFGR